MRFCPQCQQELSIHDGVPAFCPKCGADVHEGASRWTTVAKMNNLAEIGYFADLLESRNITTDVLQHNDFNALDGVWRAQYGLRVSRRDAAEAAQILKQEISPEDEEGVEAGAQFPRFRGSLALLAVVGGIAYCVGRGTAVDIRPAPQNVAPLWEALSESDAPLTSEPRGNLPRRRLRYEPESGHIVLEDDLDADGHFDRARRFTTQANQRER